MPNTIFPTMPDFLAKAIEPKDATPPELLLKSAKKMASVATKTPSFLVDEKQPPSIPGEDITLDPTKLGFLPEAQKQFVETLPAGPPPPPSLIEKAFFTGREKVVRPVARELAQVPKTFQEIVTGGPQEVLGRTAEGLMKIPYYPETLEEIDKMVESIYRGSPAEVLTAKVGMKEVIPFVMKMGLDPLIWGPSLVGPLVRLGVKGTTSLVTRTVSFAKKEGIKITKETLPKLIERMGKAEIGLTVKPTSPLPKKYNILPVNTKDADIFISIAEGQFALGNRGYAKDLMYSLSKKATGEKNITLANKAKEILSKFERPPLIKPPITPEAPPVGVEPPTGRMIPPEPPKVITGPPKPPEPPKMLTEALPKKTLEKTPKIVKQEIRADKLNIPEQNMGEIEKRLEALGLEKRKVRTFGDMQDAAEELGTDVRTLLKQINRPISDAEAIGLKNVISSNSDRIIQLQKEVLMEPAKKVIYNLEMVKLNNEINIALRKLVKGGTEAGRTVASFRILANKTLEPEFWYVHAKRMLGNREFTLEMQSAIFKLAGEGNRAGLANFVSMLRTPSWSEKAITLWKAGLLTSPTTHFANIQGNITMALLETFKDIPGVALDRIISLATRKRSVVISPRTIWNKIKGIGRGLKAGYKFTKTGIYDVDIMAKYDISKDVTFKSPILNAYTKSIFRSLGAEDIVFRKAALSESLAKQAEIIAKNMGLRGSAFKSRVKELLLNPTDEMVMNALDVAEYATFQSKNVLADLISGGRRAIAKKGLTGELTVAATEITAPFVRTPTNIAFRIADFSPLGFIKAMVRLAGPTTRSQLNFVNDISRAVTGTGIVSFGTYLATKGILTGNAPTSKAERDMFYAEGKQPNSLKVGDTWFRLDRISPFGNLLTLGADFYELSREKRGIPLVTATVGRGLKTLTEQTFLRGVSGALKAITEPERSAERFLEQTIASAVPTIITRLARTIDPRLRVPEGVIESIQRKIPFLRETLPVRRDIWGEPVVSPGGELALIDPFSRTIAKEDPVIDEAKRIDMVIGLPGDRISGIKLTSREYDIYQEIQGKALKRYLDGLIKSERYQSLGITEKKKQLEGIVRKIRTEVNDKVFPALMITRYSLPKDTHPAILRELLSILSKKNEFMGMSTERQGEFLRKQFEKIKSRIK